VYDEAYIASVYRAGTLFVTNACQAVQHLCLDLERCKGREKVSGPLTERLKQELRAYPSPCRDSDVLTCCQLPDSTGAQGR